MFQEAGSSTVRQRVRLTKDGAAYLTNYVRTVNSYPTKTEKEAILATLRAIPGNELWTIPKLSSWFARHRNLSSPSQANVSPPSAYLHALAGDPHPSVLLDEETILFPKLIPQHLQQLRALYKKRPEPSEGIITFWAERIKAERAEVVAWIQYQQEKAKENDARATPVSPEIPLQRLAGDISDSASVSPTVPEFPRPHLPTPAKSPTISPYTRMPSLPPIAVKAEESQQCLSPVSLLDSPSTLLNPRPASYMQPGESRSVLEGLPPLSRLHLQTAKPPPVSPSIPSVPWHGKELRRRDPSGMSASIRESLRIDATLSEPPPRTADEFAEKFEKVENMIEVFMEKYDSGRLAPLGWDSRSLSKSTS